MSERIKWTIKTQTIRPLKKRRGVFKWRIPTMSHVKDLKKGQKKGIPQDHWKIDVSASVFPKGGSERPSDAFLPTPGKERAQPHVKVNECDH